MFLRTEKEVATLLFSPKKQERSSMEHNVNKKTERIRYAQMINKMYPNAYEITSDQSKVAVKEKKSTMPKDKFVLKAKAEYLNIKK